MEKLQSALDALKKLDEERDNVTYRRRTNQIAALMTVMGEFVDDELLPAIEAASEALKHIAELEEKIKELEQKIEALEESTHE